MKNIITYGTFDLLHPGHINILKNAKDLGDYLIVGLSTDEFNDLKGKKSFYTFDQRRQILESIKYVDKVIPECDWEQKIEDIITYNIDTFVMGSDWVGKFDDLDKWCNVKYFNRTPGISTTIIKKKIKDTVK
ncbi:glycerol-3-phosphate cytidylyltransferase [Rossellomorea aquimaris]|uniref:glycerol-3-phosphate cytidylyltransferase n=1 Tax=Rossellomorea aquimaris TaxID=189382 RepID=UPI0005C8FAA1|nr:glycerol-3-phosphate cytidylyltransferase [Rossellomorea aquimaris]